MIDRLRHWAKAHRGLATACAVGLAVLLVAVIRLVFRPAAGGAAPERSVSVGAETARTGDIAVYLDGIGTVTPRAMVTVHSRVDGELMAVHFREGDIVASGDLLAEIDPRPFQVQLAQAEGQLARDQALLANAKVDLLRYRALAKDDAIPKQQLDTQEALVRQDEAALVVDRGQIDAAKLNLVYCRIVSPVAGSIVLSTVRSVPLASRVARSRSSASTGRRSPARTFAMIAGIWSSARLKTTSIGRSWVTTTRPPASVVCTMLPSSTSRSPTRPPTGAVTRL